jgi:hypothetical protein
MTASEDARLMAGDLSSVSGELSEIATVWRRSLPYLPELPLDLPVRLQEAARLLAADARTLEDGSPGQPPGLALRVGEQLFALAGDIAAARVMTSGPGIPDLGDAGLWETVSADLQRAASELIGFILNRAPETGRTPAAPLRRTA